MDHSLIKNRLRVVMWFLRHQPSILHTFRRKKHSVMAQPEQNTDQHFIAVSSIGSRQVV